MKISGKLFLESICDKAIMAKKMIVLPEWDSPRIQAAAKIIEDRGIAKVIFPRDTKNSPDFDEFVHTYYELRREKGVTLEQAREIMADPNFFSTMMVYKGRADGMVSGAEHTTAATIRPALQFIKTKPGISLVSGVFFMCVNDTVLVFADCAVNPTPDAKCLAEIAVETAKTAAVFAIQPRVAMLSYSTGSSGSGQTVDMARQAVEIALKINPSLMIDGPIQFDAAVDPDTAKLKMPNSKVAGQATVFIFPNLDAGNIAYKAVQRLTGCLAIGPVLQGLNKPVNDLSRGCTVDDIINTVAVTAVQAI